MTFHAQNLCCKRKRADCRWHNAAGFTLMEVMVGSVILAFVLVSTIAVISRASQYQADLRVRARSSQVLQQRVEELRTYSWAQVTNCAATFTNSYDTTRTFAGRVNITPYQYAGTTVVVERVTVTVTWLNRHNRLVTNELATLIGKNGVNKTSL